MFCCRCVIFTGMKRMKNWYVYRSAWWTVIQDRYNIYKQRIKDIQHNFVSSIGRYSNYRLRAKAYATYLLHSIYTESSYIRLFSNSGVGCGSFFATQPTRGMTNIMDQIQPTTVTQISILQCYVVDSIASAKQQILNGTIIWNQRHGDMWCTGDILWISEQVRPHVRQ